MECAVIIEKYYYEIKKEIERYEDFVSPNLVKYTEDLYEFLEKFPDEVKQAVAKEIYNIKKESHIFTTVWLYSFLIHLVKKPILIEELIDIVISSNKLKCNTKYFLYYQIKAIMFDFKSTMTEKNLQLKWEMLQCVYQDFKSQVSIPIERISIEKRNENMALVITEQFLKIQHGPTKTTLDRCYTLMKKMGKEVLLINTAEILSQEGEIPFFSKRMSNYHAGIKHETQQFWNNCSVPYFQCENNMPDIESIEILLKYIYELKPAIVISIGGSSIVAGFVNELVPALNIGLTSSGISETLTDYQTTEDDIPQMHLEVLKKMKIPDSHIIKGKFTFSLRKQTEFCSRREIGLPEDKFLLAVVGARLNIEITREFLQMLQNIVSEKINVVFMGVFDKFHELMDDYPKLKEKSICMGFVEDILARLELCDLYVNPIRKGGGTSVVEAMAKNKPVITTTYGDVAGIVGKEFCCKDYEEMETVIKKYQKETKFYQEMAEKAGNLAKELLDTETEFKRIVIEFLSRQKNI